MTTHLMCVKMVTLMSDDHVKRLALRIGDVIGGREGLGEHYRHGNDVRWQQSLEIAALVLSLENPARPDLTKEAETLAQLIAERMGPDYSDGIWRTCSGCYETFEGHDCGHYPHSLIFNCKLGGGCAECGGIGAIWDTTDYDKMARPFATTFGDALNTLEQHYYTDAELAEWLTSPQPLLEGITPIDALAQGKKADVIAIVERLDDGVYL